MSVIGTLAVRIVGDASNLNRTLTTSDASVKKFARSAGLVLAAAAGTFAVFAKRAIDSMDAMSKMAQSAGVSVRAMTELGHAAELSGLTVQQLSQTFSILSRRMTEAEQGSKTAKASFDALQIDPSQFQTADEALMAVAERFAQMPDGIQKTAAASQLFGDRVGRQLIPFLNQGRSGLEELRKEANRLGIAFGDEAAKEAEKFNDNLKRLGDMGRSVFYEMAESWLPTVNDFVSALIDARNQSLNLGEALFVAFGQTLPTSLADMSQMIIEQEINVRELRKEYEKLAGMDAVDFMGLGAAAQSRLRIEEEKLRQLQRRAEFLEGASEQRPTFALPPERDFSGSTARDQLAERLDAVRKITKEFERERNFQLEMMQIQDAMLGMTRDEQAVQEVVNRVLQDTSKNLQEIADKRLEAANLGASKQILDQFDKEAAKVQELADEYVQLAETQKRAAIEAQRQFSFGWNTAFAQYAEDATNSALVARDMFTSMTSNINNAISNLVENGKISFSDLASSIIKDIIRIQLQAQVSQAFSQIIGIVGSAIGGMFSASTAMTIPQGTAMGAGTTAGGAGAVAFPVSLASGGYTGNGGQFEPAGIVHRGEYVLNAAATRRIGLSNLDKMNKGFASGGYAGGSMSSGVNINIKNEAGADGYKATAQARTNSDGGLNIDVLVRRVVSADIQNNGALAQQMASTFGLSRSI